MFRDFLVQLTMVLTLAGAETFRREEMTIQLEDVKKALRRLRPNEVESYQSCSIKTSIDEQRELYSILYNSFGPGINMTTHAYSLLRSAVQVWHWKRYHVEEECLQSG